MRAGLMDLVAAPTTPLPGRSCGGCTLCCKVLGVPALEKPRGTWCSHCERGTGCRIYETRPDACRTFLCGWLVNPRFGAEWKPERSKIVDRKSTRLNSSHLGISYAVFCLKK